jgi:ankyrin repeat protein
MRLPLHIASTHAHSDSFQVVSALLDEYPEGARVPDENGALPLHYACEDKSMPVAVVQRLLDVFPKGAQMPDEHGELPLHYALKRDYSDSFQVVSILLDEFPKGAQMPDEDGELPLHYALKRDYPDSFQVVSILLDEFPEGARVSDKWGELPLHLVCERKSMPVAVVQRLVDLCPCALSTMSGLCNGFPLHIACRALSQYNACPMDIVRLLIRNGPNIVSETCNSELPLHAACNGNNLEAVPLLLKHFPDGACIRTDSGRLPVHLACRQAQDDGPVRLLVESYAESLRLADNNGEIPLHTASGGSSSLAILRVLLESFPEGVYVTNDNGDLPLHCAISSGKIEKFRLLVEVGPHTAIRRTRHGTTPLQLYLRQNFWPDDATAQLLLRKQREAVKAVQDSLPIPEAVAQQVWEFTEPPLWEPPQED